MRDLLFVFQGIDGQYIKYELLSDAYILSSSVVVSPSTQKLIQELSETGWLFKKVNEWLTRTKKEQQNSQVV